MVTPGQGRDISKENQLLPEQEASQCPQFPCTWTPLASVWVEHQGFGSPSIVVQLVRDWPPKMKGKTQAWPLSVWHVDLVGKLYLVLLHSTFQEC